ncbi:tol protein [Stagonosporopsis vannaccii]|nr:tol protein [Stagonosporopsis vannaccii]
MLAVVPNGLFSEVKNAQQHVYGDTFGSAGYVLPVAYSSMSPWLTGRPVDPVRVNFPLVQEWLQHCKKKHSCMMRFSRPLQLSMIDCKTLEIVVAPPNCNYFALSYVWGAASVPVSASATAGDLPHETRDVLSTAAPVVRDAIRVVKSLGWRYLWVDKYCIPQADPMLKAEQIARMDLIYEGAYCTIVAASGCSDQDGLPGISVPRHAQPSFTLDGRDVHFVSSLPDPQAVIKSSIWNTRAWTFQEALCSARRLVFTRHQVYFECKATHACEAVELPLSLITGAHARPVLFRDEWLTGTHRFGALSAFWTAVKAYSQRSMTFDSDALTALEGILRRFQASPAFVYNIFGIPVVLEDGLRGEKDALLDNRLFIAGLSWHHGGAARRRKHFPSWTWAGWEGNVQLQRTFGGAGYTSNVRLWVRDKDGVTFPWDMFWDVFWRPEGKARCYARFECLVVEADVFKVQLVPRLYQQGRGTSTAAAKTPVFDMVSPYDPAVRYSSVIMPTNLVDQSRTTTELWDCMLLGAKTNGGNPDVMLLRWDVDGAERIWAGTLWPDKSYATRPRASFPPLLRKKFKLG